ncbi:uncharacterized protein LOC123551027 isoform X1 [Mercenaria mercenaria]|uniref:uncharacterized protein LOC123551027 isoform X1 n=1 Tax=Mercenaria mercenaria TaxID=6596 RepID=UPI00234F091A|nr:uncharacterized protein LOC123551027 isoform X1 [Mercenaria mercenaria]XP_053396450.1 uncharacterized protein LOC123551027 isoform X1 [Mercenaria mercenaria]
MPKIRPSEAKGGKRRKPKDADSRMARLIATALAKDKNTMQELKDLINKQETDDEDVQTQREDGTYVDQDDNTNVNLSGRRSFKPCTFPGQGPNSNTSRNVTIDVTKVREQLIASSLAATTRKTYERFWERFSNFVKNNHSSSSCFPATSDVVSLFIAHLHSLQFAPSTISSHLSAITYFHLVSGFDDPCNTFIIRRMILGCRKSRYQKDSRLPLLKKQVDLLLNATKHIFRTNRFLRVLYRAIILVTFHGFFRMGELLLLN